ncbi:MAG: DUF1343 domain-containing protein [Bacteroidales bacterium]|nr:DUF1343 domain-containing protein [Bacteroidales bacterium]
MKFVISLFLSSLFLLSCAGKEEEPTPAAFYFDDYEHLISNSQLGIVGNHTSMVGDVHLVDTLLGRGHTIAKIFGPEHGFWGAGNAGSRIIDEKHPVHDIDIISLYGKKKKPDSSDMDGIDIMIFDIQDVGVRFYTYISTLQYVMEACAENDVRLIVLDRPNPNGFYVDGPVLDTAYKSFVGLTPIPVVHGMTVGEYALMLNGEGWLENGVECDLEVIKCGNYSHDSYYNLPVSPSPNLPNMNSVYLYPSLCFFEGTVLSCGRGTGSPFQLFGHPEMPDRGFSFVPGPNEGSSDPRFNGVECYGVDLRQAAGKGIVPAPRLQLKWIIDAYNDFPVKENFFNSYFTLLAGNESLEEKIISGMSEEEIRASWKKDLDEFRLIRDNYLLYE